MGKRVLLTGGHAASSAFVIAEEVIRQGKPWEIYWIGFKSSVEGENISTLSSIYFPKYGIKSYSLIMGRIQRKWSLHTIPSILKIPVGFIHAFWLLIKIKPDLILSFGGFSAFPVVVIAYIMRVPIIIHEQTSVVGRANKHSAFFAKKIAISRESSREYFPHDKIILTGNPIPKEIFKKPLSMDSVKYLSILITGGQSGSVAINSAVEKILPNLLEKFKIIHLTGLKEEKKYKDIQIGLDEKLRKNYEVYGIVDPNKYNKIFNSSSFLISRAGANTVSKIIASQKPSVLIPLPTSYLDEQQKNAIFANKFANARVLKQVDLSQENLMKQINYLVKNWKKISMGSNERDNPDINAAEKIVALMQEYI